MNLTNIGNKFKVGLCEKLLLIAGPCQIESLEHCLKIANFLKEITSDLPINLVFKSSFDKANRTSGTSARGPGIEKGLEVLNEVRVRTDLPVLTDIHDAPQAAQAAQAVDVLQIPAFLCRQTDILLAAGQTGKAIHVKKGQFLAPDDMKWVAQKIESTGNKNILLCERGTCHGYRDLIVDMRGLQIMRKMNYPVVFDATHSVQSMGGSGGASGGQREFIPTLARAAAAVGIDGIFLECHENPDSAPSDAASMLKTSDMRGILETICKIRAAAI